MRRRAIELVEVTPDKSIEGVSPEESLNVLPAVSFL
jgi:hypothetical protein